MTVKLGNFRTMMLLALCSVAPPPERMAIEQASWWGDFVREMAAIGCINIQQNENGEFDFDCPEDRLEDAKRIVNRYKVQRV